MRSDLSKQNLYESVKSLIELEIPNNQKHIHFNQQKLFTLFSIGFQYFLFKSTKNPGAYIIRVEDSQLAEKLAKKSKDPSTRKFMQSLLIPRKLKFQRSVFYLDFFHIGSWNLTSELSAEKIKGALVVKNTSTRPMDETTLQLDQEDKSQDENPMAGLPQDYYYSMLKEVTQESIVIAFEKNFEGVHTHQFPFIKKEVDRSVKGLYLGKDVDIEDLL